MRWLKKSDGGGRGTAALLIVAFIAMIVLFSIGSILSQDDPSAQSAAPDSSSEIDGSIQVTRTKVFDEGNFEVWRIATHLADDSEHTEVCFTVINTKKGSTGSTGSAPAIDCLDYSPPSATPIT